MTRYISIKVAEPGEMRFTTAGDWRINEDHEIEFSIVRTPDKRYWMIVLIHEITEWIICESTGVTASEADKFDALWEEELAKGLHDPIEEAGFDKRCPYRRGHVWGARMERLFCWILGVKWKVYCDYWDNFFKINYKSK